MKMTYLRNTCQANQITDEAHESDEQLLALAKEMWPLIDDGRNEAFHGTELRIQTNE